MQRIVFITGATGFVGKHLLGMLTANGYAVRALVRSVAAAEQLRASGIEPILGDLEAETALQTGLQNAHAVFHLAASVDFFAPEKTLYALHVVATERLLRLAQAAGVSKFIYLGAASVIMNGAPIAAADESFAAGQPLDGYSRTKLEAENRVLSAHRADFQTAALRPPLIWGKDDPNALPAIIQAVERGQFRFIAGGKHRFVTCHVENVCRALCLAAQTELLGRAYFIVDEQPRVFREFIAQYLANAGVQVPFKTMPLWLARGAAWVLGAIWGLFRLSGRPPLYSGLVSTLGLEFVVSDARARRELGYVPLPDVELWNR